MPEMSFPFLSRVGIWTNVLDAVPAGEVRAAAGSLEALGYGAVWTGESFGRDIFTACQLLLAATARLPVAAGIASLWARDAMAAVAGQLALNEAYDGRFLLGVGVSHPPLVAMRQQAYGGPLDAMRAYLEAMDTAEQTFRGVRPPARPPRVIAALGPKMLELGGEHADGVHTYLVTPEHTAAARAALPAGHL